MGLGMHRRVDLGIKDHLGQTMTVTEINKDNAAMITPPQHPTHKDHFLTDIPLAQIVAEMGSAQIPH
jgi:hypothetical protein